MKAPFFPFNSLHKKHPFPVIYWVVPYFWDTYDSQKPWCQAMLKWLTPGELDARCSCDEFLLSPNWILTGILIISEDFFQGSRPGPHEFHPKSPGLQVSLKWRDDPLVFRLGKPWRKPGKNDQSFQRRSFLWGFIDVVSSRQSTRMLLWQAAKNNEASVHHLFLGLRFLHKQPLTLKHVACQGDNCLQNEQFSKNHYIASSSSDLAFGRGIEVHFFQKQVT